ncbi:MAG: HAD hydrolase family protein, partial [Clostridia bacterium]|nr:HAD hydrolase family protein [Clostridia bacterium]
MKFKNVLLASDFDGTLKNDEGKITDDVIDKIKYFISEGGLFTVCTGRIYQGFHLYNNEYINTAVLLGNGAMAYDYEKERDLFDDAIAEEGILPFEAVLKNFP